MPASGSLVVRSRFVAVEAGGVVVPIDDPSVTWLTQTHGAQATVVRSLGQHQGFRADAAVTNVVGPVLVVRTADCAPVLLTGDAAGRTVCVGVAHAGWRGLASGILPAVVGALRGLGATTVRASLFPSIGPECYEFSQGDLDGLAVVLGETIRAKSTTGRPALDMVAGVRSSLVSCGVTEFDTSEWACTACDERRFYSFRARKDQQRMGLFAWLESGGST
jgi:polyphenol oxidase